MERTVLLVEDSGADALLVSLAFQHADATVSVVLRDNGQAALDYLLDPAEQLPDLVLLDLAMPGLSGHDVIAKMRAEPHLRRLPVIILTSSDDPEDITRSYSARANAYVVKPVDVRGFQSIAQAITRFWFRNVTLPR